MGKRFLELNDISAYKMAYDLSNDIWDLVGGWGYFSKSTIGNQFVRAIDSVSANVAEGFGRYYKKEKIKFYYYAKGSISEAKDWLKKAFYRNLIEKERYNTIARVLNQLPKELNSLIKFTNMRLSD
jgi:four helix bundle protein